MGRKPNQLVLEYFDRGAKLEDNSNRYVHTCKACGRVFPKGRVEGLIAHVAKNCAGIRREDRMRILSQATPAPQPASQHRNNSDPLDCSRSHVSEEHQSIPAVSSGRSLTGLEALAEASRQLEHPRKPGIGPALQGPLIDPDLEGECSIFGSPDLVGRGVAENASATDLEARLPPADGEQQKRDQDQTVQSLAWDSQQSALSKDPSFISSTTTDPHELVEDPVPVRVLPPPAPRPLPNRPHINPQLEPNSSSGQHHRVLDKSHGRAQKVRGKFTDSRRQEVQEIRKRGACIRCRMLRKTCSGESPCKTCASVVSARVWKLDCMRTSIYKEVEIFRTGFFRKLASRPLERWKEQQSQERVECFVKLASGAGDAISLCCISQLDRRKNSHGLEGHDVDDFQSLSGNLICIDETTDQILSKLLPSLRTTIFHPSYREPPLLSSQTFSAVARSEDKLLAQSFNLWSLLQVIVSNPDGWNISVDPSKLDPNHQRQVPGHAEGSWEPTSGLFQSCHIVTAQLHAAAEQGAADISKNIMVELEKRLERKERCQGFETFFVGVILLNCIERMSWAMNRASLTNEIQDWTLGRSIDSYIDQAAQFAEFLSKLFQMRGILADVRSNSDDGTLQGGPRNTPTVDQWLSEMRLTSTSLEERREAPFDPSDHRCFDFRFASRLLLLIE
ncbi:MAG: hypothetical protein LQ349_002904 [Xanthoria aureola]|nr:MAG: hypothetical protein LQ349_002904 [Xanthoria aureola]